MDTSERYKQFLTDKKVCLVGGGDSYQADLVNLSFDIVARVGSHLHEQTDLRCDILYHSGSDPENVIDLLNGTSQGFIVTNSLKPQSVERFKNTGIATLTFPMNCHKHKERYEPFCSELGDSYAFTGFLAIAHLLSYPIKELCITGMDLQPENLGKHNSDIHAKWLKERVKRDPRIMLDSTLRKVLLG